MKIVMIPQRHQRLYKCWDGKLEAVLFRCQSISEGASIESWLVFDPKENRAIRVSIGSYFTTPSLAWKAELKNYQNGLKQQQVALKKAREEINSTKATIARLKKMVAHSSSYYDD